MSDIVDRPTAEAIVDAEKDAGGIEVEWQVAKVPGTNLVISKQASFGVAVAPAISTVPLLVTGAWQSESQIQIRLQAIGPPPHGKAVNIVRLCWTPAHGDDLHWHYFEEIGGRYEVISVSSPPDTIDERTMLQEVFVPTMKIVNLAETLL